MIDVIWRAEFQQIVFRNLVEAFSRPGKLNLLPECSRPAIAVLATLVDGESRLADPHQQLDSHDWQRLQAKSATVESAAFVFCKGENVANFAPTLGTLASPEKGATLVLTIDDLQGGDKTYQLSGVGMETPVQISPQGLDMSWFQQRAIWNGAFPLGVDMLLVTAEGILALPRTTKIKEMN